MVAEGQENPVDLDEKFRSVGNARLSTILEEVHALSNTAQIPPDSRDAFVDRLTQILAKVTEDDLLALLRLRLADITSRSHENFIAVGKGSVNQLRRRSAARQGEEEAEFPVPPPSDGQRATEDEFRVFLADTEAEEPYGIGDFLVEQNPYMLAVKFKLRKTVSETELGSLDTAIDSGLGGQFEGRNSYGPWKPGKDGLAHIPHPMDPGSKTWYMVTGFKPNALPPIPSPEWDAIKSRARNIVKTVEIEYLPKIDAGDSVKFPHVFIMYAGGNST